MGARRLQIRQRRSIRGLRHLRYGQVRRQQRSVCRQEARQLHVLRRLPRTHQDRRRSEGGARRGRQEGGRAEEERAEEEDEEEEGEESKEGIDSPQRATPVETITDVS